MSRTLSGAIGVYLFASHCLVWGSDFASTCGRNLKLKGFSGPRVVSTSNGDTGPPGSWPWMVSAGQISSDGKWEHRCGGTIVAPKFVLTAAHCVFDSRWLLRMGDRDLDSNFDNSVVITRSIKKTHVHPKFVYDLTAYYDVAIWELDQDITFNNFYSPICVPGAPSSNVDKFEGDQVTVLGWGLQTTFGSRKNNVLRQTPVKVFSNAHCNYTHQNFPTADLQFTSKATIPKLFQDHLMCAGYEVGNFGSCKGDSGGPIIRLYTDPPHLRYVQVGIVQGGVGNCGDSRYPGIYTRLEDPEIYEFIRNITQPFQSFVAMREHLFTGATSGNLSLVQNAVEQGFTPNFHHPSLSLTPLHLAIDNEHLGIVDYLLRHGANVNETTDSYPNGGWRPLARAADIGNVPIAKSLVRAGADVNQADPDDRTALTTACKNGHFDMVKYLLSVGANINQVTYFGTSCFTMAMGRNSSSLVDFLLKQGASVDPFGSCHDATPNTCHALKLAMQLQNAQILRSVLGSASVSNVDEPWMTDGPNPGTRNALDEAIDEGWLEGFKILLQFGAQVDQTFTNYNISYAPLFKAAEYGRFEMVKILVESGADPNYHEPINQATPFRYACLGEHNMDVIKYLLEKGADIEERSAAGSTCLMVAIVRKMVDSVKYLVAQGADTSYLSDETLDRTLGNGSVNDEIVGIIEDAEYTSAGKQ